ncbi:MAG: 1-deoxy-D-xylulose-5-phosphate reductoisomerase [Candidatus Dormibacteria bacterium]
MTRTRVVLLGATGSIGTQACDVIARFSDRFELVGATAGRDAAALRRVAERFGVARTALAVDGEDAVCEVAALDCDVVCIAIPGAAALRPTLAAVAAGRTVATATKEVLVMAGEMVTSRARQTGASIVPVDSEHSAVWQCLRGEDMATVRRLVLTASGGPFRDRDLATMETATVEEALRHPTWSMGPKVTIDSATMMNKGLEIIEAHFLFGIPYDAIDVALHPTSIVHSLVEFVDGASVAQLGLPDMRVPIALALAGGRRLPGIAPPVSLPEVSPLEFCAVDPRRFPAVEVARAAGLCGGVAPAVLNAANEVAVTAFLAGRIRLPAIVPLVEDTVAAAERIVAPSLDDVVAADSWAREHAAARLAAVSSGV